MLIFPDECSGTAPDFQPPCRDNEQCTNTFAGFTCSCRCGYTKTSDDTIDPQCTKASDQVCDPWESLKAWYTFDDTLANQHRTAYLGKAEDSRAMLKRDRAQVKNLPTHIYSVNSAAGKALRLEGARLQRAFKTHPTGGRPGVVHVRGGPEKPFLAQFSLVGSFRQIRMGLSRGLAFNPWKADPFLHR